MAGSADSARCGLPVLVQRGLDLVVGTGQDRAGAQCRVGLFPECPRSLLPPDLDIRDRAAAVFSVNRAN